MHKRLTTPYIIGYLSLVMVWLFYSSHGEINRDGVLYLTQAHYFVQGNWDKAMSIYNWPFFSFLIASLSRLGLKLQPAAHLINATLFLFASLFTILITGLVSDNKVKPIFPGLILLTSIPLMDDYLVMVLRDHGMWAGLMTGVYAYLRWLRSPNFLWSLLWQLGFLFGTLFRPECLIFNILLPIHQFFFIKTERLKSFMQSISTLLIGLLFLPIILIILNMDMRSIDFSRLNEIITRPAHFLNTILQPLPIESHNDFLKILIADYATSFKYFFLSYVVMYKWVAGLGLLHLFLFGYAVKQKLIPMFYLKVLVSFFILSSIITIINLYTTYIITSRYWLMNFWIVYIFASIGLGHFWDSLQHLKQPKQSLMRWGLLSIVALYFLNIIIDKPEEHFEQAAGRWIKENHLDLNNIYFNQKRVAYYADLLTFDLIELQTAIEVKRYQHLVIRYNRFSEIKDILNYQPIKYFPSQQSPKIIIFKRIEND